MYHQVIGQRQTSSIRRNFATTWHSGFSPIPGSLRKAQAGFVKCVGKRSRLCVHATLLMTGWPAPLAVKIPMKILQTSKGQFSGGKRGMFCSGRNILVPMGISEAKTSLLSWRMVPALCLGFLLAAVQDGAGSCLETRSTISQLHVCPGGERGISACTDTRKRRKEKKKRKKKYVNNLRDKASATKAHLFQEPAAGFGHFD